ncbi:MAG TPA: FAD-dependent oxidoreductase [Nitrospirae bacterium]|nr:FAD-dependent oxidoreductase [Nitrospirota bacterium]
MVIQEQTYRPYGYEIKEKRPFSPCRSACPVNTDVQAYIALISTGRYNEAFEVIRSVNPIASACSYICHHPCEQACRRCSIDEPLAIRHLKRFALEKASGYRRSKRRILKNTQGKNIAIIGSGPSGLTVANDLADLGYGVTIYEKHLALGGMLASAIPPYRLPREALQEDIDDILSKGVKAILNCQVGKDISLNEIIQKNDAVVIAVGLSQSRSLNIPNIDSDGVLLAIPFLTSVVFNRGVKIGKNVLVIGGGNVAIDVARTARRLGSNVEMVCLESAEEMPAWKWEIEEAMEEGIKIRNRWGPNAVIKEDEKVKELEVIKVLSVFDKQGKFNPSFDKNVKDIIQADTIIITIGQMSDNSFAKDSPLKIEGGRFSWDPNTQMTNHPSVFITGEVVTGPGSAIAAVASGHKTAHAVHLFLQGQLKPGLLPNFEKEKIEQIPEEIKGKIKPQSRLKILHLEPAIRCQTFDHFERGYDEESALKEAGRCRGCGGGAIVDSSRCMACLTCKRVCPYGAPIVKAYSEIRPEFCQACGLCVSECPAQAISMVSYDVREIRDNMPVTIGILNPDRKIPVIAGFFCTHHVGVKGFQVPDNIRVIPLSCVSRLDVLDILKAFQCGADKVAILKCPEDSCKYESVNTRFSLRLSRAKKLLQMLSIQPEKIVVLSELEVGELGDNHFFK